MKPTILVCGHGPGISDAVARRFGKEGLAVALVARNAERLTKAAEALTSEGISAKAYPCDLANEDAVRGLVREVHASSGPIRVLHWNAYGGGGGDLAVDPPKGICTALDVAAVNLVAAVQESLADLRAEKGAVLVTGGGLAFYDPQMDAMAVSWKAMGMAIAKAAQHKTAALLHHRLAGEGIYVGELVILGAVKGTAFDKGNATLDASTIADKFWGMFTARKEATANFTG